MIVSKFKSICNECHHTFDMPLLSDLAYGEFIVRDKSGKRFSYLTTIGNQGFSKVSEIFDNLTEKKMSYKKHFLWVLAECLDPINGEKMDVAHRPICPKCHSYDIKYGSGEKTGEIDLPETSFFEFLSLSAEEQIVKIEKLLSSITSQAAD